MMRTSWILSLGSLAKEVYINFCLTVVFNLTNNIDVEKTRQIMEQYQRENRDVIQRNKVKLVSMMAYVYSLN